MKEFQLKHEKDLRSRDERHKTLHAENCRLTSENEALKNTEKRLLEEIARMKVPQKTLGLKGLFRRDPHLGTQKETEVNESPTNGFPDCAFFSTEVVELKRTIECVKAGYGFHIVKLEGDLEASQVAYSDREKAHDSLQELVTTGADIEEAPSLLHMVPPLLREAEAKVALKDFEVSRLKKSNSDKQGEISHLIRVQERINQENSKLKNNVLIQSSLKNEYMQENTCLKTELEECQAKRQRLQQQLAAQAAQMNTRIHNEKHRISVLEEKMTKMEKQHCAEILKLNKQLEQVELKREEQRKERQNRKRSQYRIGFVILVILTLLVALLLSRPDL